LDEDAIIVVLDVPFAVIERVTVGFGTTIQSKLVEDSNQDCNGSPAHLPVGSRIRITAAASKRVNLIPLRPAYSSLATHAAVVRVFSVLVLNVALKQPQRVGFSFAPAL
jgi:hypothetical protein